MLPGFRFLFAAIMLSMSLLIFGLGAAALFRAAHESFASNSWRATPEAPFAQRPETTLAMLATLRVAPVTEKAPDAAKVATAPTTTLPAAIAEPMTSDQVAALSPAETPATEVAKTEIAKPADTTAPAPAPIAEDPTTPVAPVGAETAISGETKTAAPAEETKTATVAAPEAESIKSGPAAEAQPEPAMPPTTNQAIVAPAAPTATMAISVAPPASVASATASAGTTAPEPDGAVMKIATLGGPPVDITDSEAASETRTVKLPRARPDESAIKRRQQARRALRRRRLAARARLAAQLQANPFGQQPLLYAQPQQNLTPAAPR